MDVSRGESVAPSRALPSVCGPTAFAISRLLTAVLTPVTTDGAVDGAGEPRRGSPLHEMASQLNLVR